MYTSKLKIKKNVFIERLKESLLMAGSLRLQGRPQKKPADHNCWDDGEARREDLGWQSEDVVRRRHWRQTGRGRRGTGVLCCADRSCNALLIIGLSGAQASYDDDDDDDDDGNSALRRDLL